VRKKPIDLAAAVAAAEEHQARPMMPGELVKAWSTVTLDGSDTRLRVSQTTILAQSVRLIQARRW